MTQSTPTPEPSDDDVLLPLFLIEEEYLLEEELPQPTVALAPEILEFIQTTLAQGIHADPPDPAEDGDVFLFGTLLMDEESVDDVE
ncbi:MAG: hypothetical protein EAY65_04320 [Alphaproteobacteria bacterium]|nr:MAG: hypothetical protein EAY65_04320 [Alphaproteobacteria bacterium]